jgi:CDP-paratose 2-epimerase
MAEAIAMAEELTGQPLRHSYNHAPRLGDHIWWISDGRKFEQMYPEWSYRYDIRAIMSDIHAGLTERLGASCS